MPPFKLRFRDSDAHQVCKNITSGKPLAPDIEHALCGQADTEEIRQCVCHLGDKCRELVIGLAAKSIA